MDDNALDRLFSGDLDRLIPLPKRLVRLFISSTFTDMTLERNSLMERVYPKLKKYCRERHGLDFQVVDMRWGVRDEATDDHQTVNLCSREIDNCQRMSLGPNFIALLGDKYGFRPLCNRIKSNEYRALRRCLIELDVSTDFLDTWYKEDLNAVPPEYILQPISSILRNFTNKSEPDLQAVDQRIWSAIQERLHELLMIGSRRLVEQGRLNPQEQLMRYSISVTEREVIEGCLDENDAKSHCLVYVRSIVDLKHYLDRCLSSLSSSSVNQLNTSSDGNSPRSSGQDRRDSQTRRTSLKIGDDVISLTTSSAQTASERRLERTRKLISRFIDLRATNNVWQLDEASQVALTELKEVKLEAKLKTGGRNLIKFRVLWNEQDGISLKSEEHKHYLQELTDHFYTKLTKMIRKAAKNQQEFKSGLIGEVLQHSHYAKHVSRTFHGRLDELDMIQAYVLSSPEAARLPLFVYGVGGSGKTSILARTATLCRSWIQQSKATKSGYPVTSESWDEKPCVVMRFCSATPSSSSMVGVLSSVCLQLQFNFYQYGPLSGTTQQLERKSTNTTGPSSQLPCSPIPEDFVRLVFTFRQLLDNCQHPCHRSRLFVIILDSIDRLTSPADAKVEVKYSWLTSVAKLPANVRLIVSCSTEASADYTLLKRHFLRAYLNVFKNSIPDDLDGGEEANLDETNSLHSEEMLSPTELDLNQHNLRRLVTPAIKLMQQQTELRCSDSSRDPQGETPLGEIATNSVENQTHSNSKPSSGLQKASLPFSHKKKGSRKVANFHSPDGSRETISVATSKGSFASRIQEPASTNYPKVWILHVKPMGVQLALSVARRWLAEVGRHLTQPQWSAVEKCFSYCSRPIFVKLAFGEVVNWKSYSMQSDNRGLTFGSSLLNVIPENSSKTLTSTDPKLNEALNHLTNERFLDVDRLSKNSEEFRWQTLMMEQQWLNYLDYNQRKEQRLLDLKLATDSGSTKDGSLVIRIGSNNDNSKTSSTVTPSATMASSICHLSNTIDDAINQLFGRIELQHGYLLTKHSLSYINAARNGICENELEDILSLDDVVLDDVFQYHLPPVRRIPPLLWTRIRNDLPDYLSERDADGIVVNWHHSQFKQATQNRYLSEVQQVLYIHSIMADYFLGCWADKAKPFKCTKQQIQMAAEQLESAVQQSLKESPNMGSIAARPSLTGNRLINTSVSSNLRTGASFSARNRLRSSDQPDQRLQWMQAKADRRVPHQPLIYVNQIGVSTKEIPAGIDREQTESSSREKGFGDGSRTRYNMRKLIELPHHLIKSGRFLDLANEVIFNYRWLYSALESLGLQSLLSDFVEALKSLQDALKMASTLEASNEPDTALLARNQELELRGVQPPDILNSKAISSMIHQLMILNDTIRLSCSAIHQNTQMLAPQLIGRLLPLVMTSRDGVNQDRLRSLEEGRAYQKEPELKYLTQILDQCDRDGSSDCGILPICHCLQSPNGLQLSSLEGHPFAIMSMALADDRRHLLAVSNRFIMWDISTGEVSRDIDPDIKGAIMRQLKMAHNNEFAVAYSSDNMVLVLDILTQQVTKYGPICGSSDLDHICGLSLINNFNATKFVVWTQSRWLVMNVKNIELSKTVSSDKRICIEVVYEQSLREIVLDSSLNLDVIEVKICTMMDKMTDMVFVTLANKDTQKVELLVFLVNPRSNLNSDWDCFVWPERIVGLAMGMNLAMTQVIYATQDGDILIRNRQTNGWSEARRVFSSGNDLNSDSHSLEESKRFNIKPFVNTRDTMEMPLKPIALDVESVDWHSSEEATEDLNDLVDFEIKIDALEGDGGDEVGQKRVFAAESDSFNEDETKENTVVSSAKNIILYFYDKVILLDGAKDWKERNFLLPRDTRNISIELNKSQLKAITVNYSPEETNNKASFMVASTGRRLLIYSTASGNLLKNFDAHGARIVQLLSLSLPSYPDEKINECDIEKAGKSHNDHVKCFLASASMDKTVKVWNLANLDKEVHQIDRLEGSIESISIAATSPLAACLARDQVGLWNWWSGKMISQLGRQVDSSCRDNSPDSEQKALDELASERLVACKLAANARYLAIATTKSISLLSIENSGAAADIASERAQRVTNNTGTTLRVVFTRKLPEPGFVRKLKFFSQDSRLLSVLECRSSATKPQLSGNLSRGFSEDSDDPSALSQQTTLRLTRRLLVMGHAIPDGRQMFTIEHSTPIVQASTESNYSNAFTNQQKRESPSETSIKQDKNIRLPVLTRDNLHVVTVEIDPEDFSTKSLDLGQDRRKSSVLSRLPVALGVYSSRDGLLVRLINLTKLEVLERPTANVNLSELQPAGSSVLGVVPAKGESQHHSRSERREPSEVSIGSEQFCRIKSVSCRERQSVIALLDDERGTSFMVDAYTRRLISSYSNWTGKLSSDGRLGLGRMFKASAALKSKGSRGAPNASFSTGELQVLEMRRGQAIKTLISQASIAQLSGLVGRGEASGSEPDTICGFTRPNDAYVYYCNSRSGRLLLIRLRDTQIMANYKLSSPISKIRCSPDGQALLLGGLDGSLSSLAIVDPQNSDSLARLAQYPSRKR